MKAPREAEHHCQGPTVHAVGAKESQLPVKRVTDQAFLHRVAMAAAVLLIKRAARIKWKERTSRKSLAVTPEVVETLEIFGGKTVNGNHAALHRRNANFSRQAKKKRAHPRVGPPLACL